MTAPLVDSTPAEETAPTTLPPTDASQVPAWYQAELSKVRGEAANYRTKLRELETKFKAVEGLEATLAELKAAKEQSDKDRVKAQRDALVAKVAKGDSKNGIAALPDELAELLQGDTEEELKAHAEKLRKLLPPRKGPERLSGGLNGNANQGDSFDPVAFAKSYAVDGIY